MTDTAAKNRPTAARPTPQQPPEPWWRVSMMWLVVLGPMAVVLAGVLTAVLAVRSADGVVRTSAQGTEQPAVQARNHAATPKK